MLKGRIKTGRQPLWGGGGGSSQPRRGNRRLTSAKPSFSEQASQHHLLHPTFQTTLSNIMVSKPGQPSVLGDFLGSSRRIKEGSGRGRYILGDVSGRINRIKDEANDAFRCRFTFFIGHEHT